MKKPKGKMTETQTMKKPKQKARLESETKAGRTYAYANPRPTHRCPRHKKLRKNVYVFVRSAGSSRAREIKALAQAKNILQQPLGALGASGNLAALLHAGPIGSLAEALRLPYGYFRGQSQVTPETEKLLDSMRRFKTTPVKRFK